MLMAQRKGRICTHQAHCVANEPMESNANETVGPDRQRSSGKVKDAMYRIGVEFADRASDTQ